MKRRLSGAALAAYNRKRSQTALVPYAAASPVLVARAAPARRSKPKRRKARRASAPRSRTAGLVSMVTSKLAPMAGSAAYGWLTKPPEASELAAYIKAKQAGQDYPATTIQLRIAALPYIDAIGRKGTHGIALAAIGALTSGTVAKIANALGNAALHAWAFDLGRSDVSFKQAATVAGPPEDQVFLAGAIDADDYED